MNFRRGQKVVCVDDSPHWLSGLAPTVKAGSVYTVVATFSKWGIAGVHLEGILPAGDHEGHEARRFRPAVTRKTDISIFTQILDDVRAGKVREYI